MSAPVPPAGPPAPAGAVADTVRRWRLPVAVVLLVLAAGAVIALLRPSPPVYLDPGGTGPSGGHALADLATARGQRVIPVTSPPSVYPQDAGVELITSPELLTAAQLTRAARFRGDIVVTDPDSAALRVLAPAVTVSAGPVGPAGPADPGGSSRTAPPLCADGSASLAGAVDTGGAVLRTDDPAAAACYPGGGGYFLIRYRDRDQGAPRTVTVLGTGAPFTNAELADNGDAALALNLLRGTPAPAGAPNTITWLVPNPAARPVGQATGPRSFFSLVPWPAYLIVIQLAVAAVLAGAWRARRLGPLVAEKLPVVVRASETVEGHGRLYQARRARDRAAAELRAAARARIAARTGRPPGGVTGPELDGPPPATDAGLVALAHDLDELERKVRHP